VPPETLGAALIGALPEIARFLAAHARFQALSEEALARLAAAIEVEFHGRGATIPNRDDHGDALVRLVRSGSVDIVEQGRVVDQLGAGEALPDELAPTATAVAAEDVLSYRLPASLAQALLKAAGEPGTAPAAPTARSTAELSAAALARSPALVCGPEATIREVTGRMAEAGVGAALVQLSGSGGLGIVTDADLRSRVLASGLSADAPVCLAMSAPVFAAPAQRRGEALLFDMLEHGIGHIPVLSPEGELLGLVEEADLVPPAARSCFRLRGEIARAKRLEDVVSAAGDLGAALVGLHDSGVAAPDVSLALSLLRDAMTRRVLELALPRERSPSAPVVWLALGSNARRELTLSCRPRSAHVWLSDHVPAPTKAGGQQASEALSQCGFDEISEVAPLADDRRAVWGRPSGWFLAESLGDPHGDADLLGRLAGSVLADRPPTGFRGEFVLERSGSQRDRLNLWHSVEAPIVRLARWAAASSDLDAASTIARLRAASEAGVLSSADAQSLSDAFELVFALRIEHQLRQLAEGRDVDDLLNPADLDASARDELRMAFRSVAGAQERVAGALTSSLA
jgi:CBS domain-containing protein